MEKGNGIGKRNIFAGHEAGRRQLPYRGVPVRGGMCLPRLREAFLGGGGLGVRPVPAKGRCGEERRYPRVLLYLSAARAGRIRRVPAEERTEAAAVFFPRRTDGRNAQRFGSDGAHSPDAQDIAACVARRNDSSRAVHSRPGRSGIFGGKILPKTLNCNCFANAGLSQMKHLRQTRIRYPENTGKSHANAKNLTNGKKWDIIKMTIQNCPTGRYGIVFDIRNDG